MTEATTRVSLNSQEGTVKHRNNDLLLMIAIGDAYAAPVEYVDADKDSGLVARALKLEEYLVHPTHPDLREGRYTDDAQMSIAVAEALLSGQPLTREVFADAFVRVFKRDPRGGYARGFQKLLESIHSTSDFLARIRPTSPKNGACMRVVPLGVLPSITQVLEVAEEQACVTHDTLEGRISSQIVAVLSHMALYTDLTFRQMIDLIQDRFASELQGLDLDLTHPRTAPVLQPARHTVHAVCHLLRSSRSLADVLRGTIKIGGDTDTVAAIALGIASTRLHNNLPVSLIRDLEPKSSYGTPYLLSLGFQLMEAYDSV